jgi:excinuclease ABC subunit A
VKTADWVIDLGPEGGDGGGEIVAEGRVSDIIKEPRSHTGRFLREVLERRPGLRLAAE